MKYAVALSALAVATLVSAQTPDGCSSDYSGSFEFNPVPLSGASKRDTIPLHKVNKSLRDFIGGRTLADLHLSDKQEPAPQSPTALSRGVSSQTSVSALVK